MWAIKGRYDTAIEDDEDIQWTMKGGSSILNILLVGYIVYLYYHYSKGKLKGTKLIISWQQFWCFYCFWATSFWICYSCYVFYSCYF